MIEDRFRYLGSSEVITSKLDQIIEAFVTFYGEERRSEIEEKLRSVLILKFNTTLTISENIRKVKESVLREVYGLSKEEQLYHVEFLIDFFTNEKNATEKTYNLIDNEIKELVFGSASISMEEVLIRFKNGEYPKLNEFLAKYNEILPRLEPYEKLVSSEDAKKGKIREKYYKMLVDEFKEIIPKEELDFYQMIEFPGTIMKSYFDWSIYDNGHCFDDKNQELLDDESIPDFRKASVISDRMQFLKDNGYDFMTYEEALRDQKCLEFIAKSRIVCEQIAKRKSELFKKQTIELVESLEDYQMLRKKIDRHNFLNRDDPLGPFVYASDGISCYQANYTFDDEKYILSPIVLINAGATDPDCTIIHELNHAFEYHPMSVNHQGCTSICGWEYGSIEFKQEQDHNELKYQGISRENELLSEYVNDRIAQEITDIMHEQGNYIFNKTRVNITSSYMGMDFLLNDFYQEFRDIIVLSRSNGNIDYLYEKMGKDNFNALNSLVNEVYQKFGLGMGLDLAVDDYYEKRTTENARIIENFLDRRDMILGEMKEKLESNQVSR